MTAVLANVHGCWYVEKKGLTVEEAVKLMAKITSDSRGGEVYAVPEEEVARLEDERTTEVRPVKFYEMDGNLKDYS